ncbi:hypothetical protein SLS58_005243 [Diplodia intermedia]|uniref:Rna polymerase i subunit n=1 Tax=Diplodia intermedia TaxID=856260 RepID=A0ABR3TRC4_9PEZI
MSAVKRTPIPLPGRAAAAADTPSKAPKPTKKPAPKDESSDEESSSSDESSSSESVAAKTNGSKKEPVKKAQEAESNSSSEASESSEESEEEEEEESSEEGDKNAKAEQPKKAEASKAATSSGSASASGSGSEESGSESESEEESEEEATPAQTSSSSRTHTTQFRAAAAFEPPPGFKAVKSGLNPSSNLAKLLQSTDLSKKQIWYITAPADIDIKQIKQFARGKAALKEPAIEHKGVGYAFLPEEKGTQTGKKLLVPSEKGFAAVPVEITETLHLQQAVNLPKLSEKVTGSARSTGTVQKFVERPERPARPQPEGLRMRFKPYGHSGDVSGNVSDDESSAPVPKRKHGEADAPASSKKSKKEKKPKEKARIPEDAAGEAMEGVEATADAGEAEKKKKKKEKKEKKDKKSKA